MTDEIVTRWFRAENSLGEVYGIYKARFRGTTYIDEKYWYLGSDSGWSPNSGVRDWFFIGKDNVWECTAEEARAYLPGDAFPAM
jgi:hypothetical protein